MFDVNKHRLFFCTWPWTFMQLKVSQKLGAGRRQLGVWRKPVYEINPWYCVCLKEKVSKRTKRNYSKWKAFVRTKEILWSQNNVWSGRFSLRTNTHCYVTTVWNTGENGDINWRKMISISRIMEWLRGPRARMLWLQFPGIRG